MIKSILQLFLCVCFVFFSFIGKAQSPHIDWYYDHSPTLSSKVIDLQDGTFIYYSVSNASPYTSKLIKRDAERSIIWEKTYGGNGSDRIYSLIEEEDGYLFSGTSTSTDGDLTGIPAGSAWLVKVNKEGDIIWQKRFDGAPYFRGISKTTDGGYIVIGRATTNNGYVRGYYGGTGASAGDVWVAKLNSLGDTLWTTPCMGGSLGDSGSDIKEDIINGGYVFLATTSSVDNDILLGGSRDTDGKFWIVKLDEAGKIVWQKRYGGNSPYESARQLLITKEGNYVLAGSTPSIEGDISNAKGGGQQDYWVLWLDKHGDYIRDRSYGGVNADEFSGISSTADGGYLLAGRSQSDDGDVKNFVSGTFLPWVLKINHEGAIQWTKYLHGFASDVNTGTSTAIQEFADGSYLVLTQDFNLKLRPCPEKVFFEQKICQGDSYFFNDTLRTKPGVYTDTLLTVGGCDSIVTLTLQVVPLPSAVVSISGNELNAAPGSSYLWILDGKVIEGATLQTYTITEKGYYQVVVSNDSDCKDTSSALYAVPVSEDEFPLRDKYIWNFNIPGMGDQLSAHTFHEDSIEYVMTGLVYTTTYNMVKENYYAGEQRWIGVGKGGSIDKTGKYFVLFFKELSSDGDSVLIYKHECADKEEAYTFAYPAADAEEDHGWNWYVLEGTTTNLSDGYNTSLFTVHPNPVTSELSIIYSSGNTYEIILSTMQGVEVLRAQSSGFFITDMSPLPNGIYLLRVYEGKELKGVQKIVKQ